MNRLLAVFKNFTRDDDVELIWKRALKVSVVFKTSYKAEISVYAGIHPVDGCHLDKQAF